MPELENIAETGDFFAEYDGYYLGCGRAVWTLTPQAHEVRRDSGTLLRCRQICSVKWQVTLLLAGGDQIWELFAYNGEVGTFSFSGGIFADGKVLKLFPADPQQQGFCFSRCYLDEISRQSGGSRDEGLLKLKFTCEAEKSSRKYLQRMQPGAMPQAAAMRKLPDPALMSQQLLEYLGEKLDMIPGQDITLNNFVNGDNVAMLKLLRCKDWQFNMPREFEFVLYCRCRLEKFPALAGQLYAAAVSLNDYSPAANSNDVWACRVKNLEFGVRKNINAADVLENTLEFSAIVR